MRRTGPPLTRRSRASRNESRTAFTNARAQVGVDGARHGVLRTPVRTHHTRFGHAVRLPVAPTHGVGRRVVPVRTGDGRVCRASGDAALLVGGVLQAGLAIVASATLAVSRRHLAEGLAAGLGFAALCSSPCRLPPHGPGRHASMTMPYRHGSAAAWGWVRRAS